MAKNNNDSTVPGFALDSQHFAVKFVAGYQRGLVSELLEYETDWMEVMVIILENLHKFPTSVKMVEEGLERGLDDFFMDHDVADDIKASVKIYEHVDSTLPLGSKLLTVSFSDNIQLVFHIRKKVSLKTLKDLGAAAVVDNLRIEIDIEKLKIPVTLFPDLIKSFRNDFKKSNISKQRLCNFAKKKNRSNSGIKSQKKKRNNNVQIGKKKIKKKMACGGCGKSIIRISSHNC